MNTEFLVSTRVYYRYGSVYSSTICSGSIQELEKSKKAFVKEYSSNKDVHLITFSEIIQKITQVFGDKKGEFYQFVKRPQINGGMKNMREFFNKKELTSF